MTKFDFFFWSLIIASSGALIAYTAWGWAA